MPIKAIIDKKRMEIISWTYGSRTFKIGSRVKAYFDNKWCSGTVVSFSYRRDDYPEELMSEQIASILDYIIIENITTDKGIRVVFDDKKQAVMFIRTDEKVAPEDHLFNGYGIRSTPSGKDIIFEEEEGHEPEPFIIREASPDETTDLPF